MLAVRRSSFHSNLLATPEGTRLAARHDYATEEKSESFEN